MSRAAGRQSMYALDAWRAKMHRRRRLLCHHSHIISIEKEQEDQKQQGRVGLRQEWREKSAVKIWNRKNVASVQAGDKRAALHTQTQAFLWLSDSQLSGRPRAAVLSPPHPPGWLRTPGPAVTKPCTQQIQGPDTPSLTPEVLRGFKRAEDWRAPQTGNCGKKNK